MPCLSIPIDIATESRAGSVALVLMDLFEAGYLPPFLWRIEHCVLIGDVQDEGGEDPFEE